MRTVILILVLVLSAPQLLYAAEIEEIVVTAQKRSESIQDVPISVSAFDMEAMEARQIDSFSDLQFNVPNVSYSKTFFSGNNFQIRGIGNVLVAASADSGVAMHLNDVYLNSPRIFETEYYDMEQMEVLRGPQGTLFGRNATGGAVNMKTARPEMGELFGDIEGQFGNFDHRKLKGAINIPMGERVAARIAGIYLQRDGYSEDVLTGDDIDGRDQWSLRGSLRFDISDATRLDIIGHRFQEDSNRSRRQKQKCNRDPSAILGCTPDGLSFEPVNGFATAGTLLASNLLLGPLGLFNFFDQTGTADNPSDLRKQSILYQPEYESKEDFLMAELTHDLSDAVTLTVIGAMQETEIFSRQGEGNVAGIGEANVPAGFCFFSPAACTYYGLQEGGPVYLSTVPDYETSLGAIAGGNEFALDSRNASTDLSSTEGEQWSIETRLGTSFDGPVNFMLAAYYMEYEAKFDYFVQAPSLDYAAMVLAQGGGPFIGSPDAFLSLAPGFFRSETDPYELESLAVYGEMYWNVSDSVKLTFGLRYTEDDKSISDRQLFLNVPVLIDVASNTTTFLGSNGSATPVTTIDQLITAAAAAGDYDGDPNKPGGQAFREGEVSFEEVTGRIVLDWTPDLEITDETLVYFSFSRGYKGGGLNPPIDTTLFPNTPTNFDPEEIDAFEIGTKNTFWDRRAQLNASFFYYDYSDLQIGKIINRTSLNENTDADIFGAEMELLLQPTENWQINAHFSYLDTKLGDTETIDPRDPTQGRQDVTLVKDFVDASNCVVDWNGQVPFSENPVATAILAGAYFPTGKDLGGFGGVPGTVIPTTPNVADSAFSSCAAVRGVAGALGYNYLDSVGVNLKGNELLSAPKFTVGVGAQYTWFMNNGMSLTARMDYYWQDEFYSTTFNRPQDLYDSWDVINAQVQLNGPEDRWFARAFVQNLGDEDNVTGTTQGDPSTGLGTSLFLIEPRFYGLTLGMRLQ